MCRTIFVCYFNLRSWSKAYFSKASQTNEFPSCPKYSIFKLSVFQPLRTQKILSICCVNLNLMPCSFSFFFFFLELWSFLMKRVSKSPESKRKRVKLNDDNSGNESKSNESEPKPSNLFRVWIPLRQGLRKTNCSFSSEDWRKKKNKTGRSFSSKNREKKGVVFVRGL